MSMKLSRFAHSFVRDSSVAWYHALRMKPLYVEKRFRELPEAFRMGVDPQTVSYEYGAGAHELIEALRDAKIIVEEGDDDAALAHFREITSRSAVSIAYFILTDQCNFACTYCFVKNVATTGYVEKSMTPDVARAGLDTFCRLIASAPEHFEDEKTIILYGGEPLMNQRAFLEILDGVRARKSSGALPKNTVISLVTNGSLITPEIAKLLKLHEVNVSVSLDGDEMATDASRRSLVKGPVYSKIRQGIRICQDEGIEVGISCTLSPESAKNLHSTISILLDDVGTKGLGFNLVLATPEYRLPEEYSRMASECIIEAYKIFRDRGVYEDRMMRKVNAFTACRPHPFDCGASGAGQIVVAPDGQIGICHGYTGMRKHFTEKFVTGGDFDPSTDPVFAEWRKRTPFNMAQCQDCPALGICGGGCPFQADLEKGSIWELDERFCVHSKMTLEWLIWDLYDHMRKAQP